MALVAIAFILTAWTGPLGRMETKAGIALVSAAAVSLADRVAAGILQLYHFRPHLLPNPTADSRVGLLLGDLLFVPALAGALLGARTPWRKAMGAVLAFILMSIEFLFLKVGAYEHSGWRLWWTQALFTLMFTLVAWWADSFDATGLTGLQRGLLAAAALTALVTVEQTTLSGIIGLWRVRFGLLPHPVSDEVLAVHLLHSSAVLLLGFVWIWFGLLRRPAGAFILAALFAGWLWGLQTLGYLSVRAPWSIPTEALSMAVVVALAGRIDLWFVRHTEKRRAGASP